MENFKIEVEETKTYWQRIGRAMFWNFIFITGIMLFISLQDGKHSNNGNLIFIIGYIIFLAVSAFSSNELCAIFIKQFEIKGNRIKIIYKKRNEEFEINDTLDTIGLSIGHASQINGGWFKHYLEITYNKNLRIRQYNKWGWDVDSFYKTLENLKNIKKP